MITINKDPARIIPDICESDIKHKLIVAVVDTRGCLFVSYLLKDNNLVYERGCDVKNSHHQNSCKWRDSFNINNKTIIELMIKEWHSQLDGQLQYLIIENTTEFEKFLDKFNIKGSFKDELMCVWDQIISARTSNETN